MKIRFPLLVGVIALVFALANGVLFFDSSRRLVSLFSLEESKSTVELAIRYNRMLFDVIDNIERQKMLDMELKSLKDRQAFLWLFDFYNRRILKRALIFACLLSALFLTALVLIQYRLFRISIEPLRNITRSLSFFAEKGIIHPVDETTCPYRQEVEQFNFLLNEIEKRRDQEQISLAMENRNYISRMIIHEIKNALSPLFLQLESGLYPTGNDENRQSNKSLLNGLKRMETIIAQFRGLSQLPEPALVECRIASLLEKLFTDNKWNYPRIQLMADDFCVKGDPFYLELLFQNLIKNALESGEESLVQVEARQGDSVPYVNIRDNGLGFSEKDRLHLVKPGYTTKPGGEGYGLFLVKEIAAVLNLGLEFTNDADTGGALVHVRFNS